MTNGWDSSRLESKAEAITIKNFVVKSSFAVSTALKNKEMPNQPVSRSLIANRRVSNGGVGKINGHLVFLTIERSRVLIMPLDSLFPKNNIKAGQQWSKALLR